MHVPSGIIAGFAGDESGNARPSFIERVRADPLTIALSFPFVVARVKSPVKFILKYRGLSRSEDGMVVFRDGMRLKTRGAPSDMRAVLEACIWDLYTRDQNLVRSAPLVVIDIGAHIGTFSVSTAVRYPNSRVYSYEPLKANYDLLVSNVEGNHLNRVFPKMVAVSGKKGTAVLHVSSENTGGHSMFYSGGTEVKIETIPLAEVFSSNGLSRCDLLKMDCEGAEYDILFSAPDEVLKSIRNMVLEYHNLDGFTCKDIVSHLERNGFAVEFVGKPRFERNAIGIIMAKRP